MPRHAGVSLLALSLAGCQVLVGYEAKERASAVQGGSGGAVSAGAAGSAGQSKSGSGGAVPGGSAGSPTSGNGGSVGGGAGGAAGASAGQAGSSGAGTAGVGGAGGAGASAGASGAGAGAAGNAGIAGATSAGAAGAIAGGAGAAGVAGGTAGGGGASAGAGGVAGAAGAAGAACGVGGSTASAGAPGAGNILQVALGDSHTCVLLTTGNVRCWGRNYQGQLGLGTGNNASVTAPLSTNVDVGRPVKRLAAGTDHTCALLDDGTVRCWGMNQSGQLGIGTGKAWGLAQAPSLAPLASIGSDTVLQLDAAGNGTCVLFDTGKVRCWGENTFGQLGLGIWDDVGDNESPASYPPVSFSEPVVQIAMGTRHVCAKMQSGKVRCWGDGTHGQLGNLDPWSNVGRDEKPSTVPEIDVTCGPVVSVSAGTGHTCAVLDGGQLRCWGDNTFGEQGLQLPSDEHIGDDEPPSARGPIDTVGSVVQVAMGYGFTCVLLDTKKVRCWGYAVRGQLGTSFKEKVGDDELPSSISPVELGGDVVQLVARNQHVCALLDTGALRCWGANGEGQLGIGTKLDLGDDELPTKVPAVTITP